MTFDHTLATAGSEEVLIRRTEQDKKRLTLAAGILKLLNEHVPKVYKCKPFIIFKGKTPYTTYLQMLHLLHNHLMYALTDPLRTN